MEKKPQRIIEPGGEVVAFQYTYADYFRNVYSNGVWGGTNPHGEIVMNFFLEKIQPPEITKHKATESGRLELLSRDPYPDLIIREFQVGVVLNLSVARSVRDWLSDKIESMESAIAAAKKEG